MLTKDTASTIAGGGAGLALLLTVRWEAIPYGECVKVGAALVILAMGYLFYRGNDGPGPTKTA